MKRGLNREAARAASDRRVKAYLNKYVRETNQAVADCQHLETYIKLYGATEYNDVALEGGAERRCSFESCNALVEVLAV